MSRRESAMNVLKGCMEVKEEEVLLVIVDSPTQAIGELFFAAGDDLGAESLLMTMTPRKQHGAEPPTPVVQAMANSDVILAPTSMSLTHTQARKNACEKGARVATLPGITEEMISSGGIAADYEKIRQLAEEMVSEVKGGESANVKSPNGTDLTLDISGGEWHKDYGICEKPGEYTNLPAGEIFIAPKSAEGRLVVDGSMAGLGILDSPLEFEISDGSVVGISGTRSSELLEIIEEAGESGRNVAELGIGLNDEANLVGVTLEDEKVAGTVHVAIGDNSTFGGDVESDIHLDGIVTDSPQLFVDTKRVNLPEG